MEELIRKIDKEKMIDIFKNLKHIDLKEENIMLLSSYIFKNEISLISSSSILEDSIAEVDEEIFFNLEYIKNGDNKEGISDNFTKQIIDLGIKQAIKNVKKGYNFFDLSNSSYIIGLNYVNKFKNKLNYTDDELLKIYEIYCTICLLKEQEEVLKEMQLQELYLLLYIKIEKELRENKKLDDILKEKNLSHEEYENIKNMYASYEFEDIDIDLDDDFYETDIESYNVSVFTKLEEQILMNYLNLSKDNIDLLKEDQDKILNNAFKKLSEM